MQQLRYSIYLKSIFVAIDIALIVAIFLLFSWLEGSLSASTDETLVLYSILLAAFWFLISGRTKIYAIPRTLTFTLYIERVISHIVLFLVGFYLLKKISRDNFSWISFGRTATVFFLAIIVVKTIIFASLKFYRRQGKNIRNIMFLGDSEAMTILQDVVKSRKDYGYEIFTYNKEENAEALTSFWKENGIYALFIPINHLYEKGHYNNIIRAAEDAQVMVSLVPDNIYDQHYKYEVEYFEIQPVLKIVDTPLQIPSNYVIKRTFDIVFSGLVLLLIGSWLFPLLAILIKLDSRGPVFFVQKRFGLNNVAFNCLKFRTMIPNSEANEKTALKNDSRITPLGKFLRKTSLDEFPQFINVFLGQMSVVGPRPHMLSVDKHYKELIQKYSIRSTVKPGITGLAQVKGFRGDRENMDLEMRKRIKADIFYINNWSFSMDMVIILKTSPNLFFGDKKAH